MSWLGQEVRQGSGGDDLLTNCCALALMRACGVCVDAEMNGDHRRYDGPAIERDYREVDGGAADQDGLGFVDAYCNGVGEMARVSEWVCGIHITYIQMMMKADAHDAFPSASWLVRSFMSRQSTEPHLNYLLLLVFLQGTRNQWQRRPPRFPW